MKLTQSTANLIFALTSAVSTLVFSGYITGRWAQIVGAVVIFITAALQNLGYARLPNGEVLPENVRNLDKGLNVAVFADTSGRPHVAEMPPPEPPEPPKAA